MDYKVKYEKAIANARAIIKNYKERHLDDIAKRSEEDFSAVFPELKESEDERIRQRIIHALHGDVLEMSEIKEAIAWLEKQGTPAKLSEEEQNRFAKGVLSSCALSFIDYLDAHKHEGKMCVSNGECEDIENAFHNAMLDRLHRYYCKYIEKQGEQKPVPKFEVGDVMRTLQESADNITSGLPVVVSIDDEYYRCNNELIAIKDQDDYEYPPMNRMQKSWGEEEEKQRRQIERIVSNAGCTKNLQEKIHNWFDSLKDRVQPQSTWKPSDEQIGALEHFVRSITESGFASRYDSNTKLVYSLLNDLKKLKL